MTAISTTSKATSRVLLISASALALSVPASANDVLFSTSAMQVQAGQRTTQTAGLTQIKLKSGATVSITQGTQYTLNEDGSIDLHKGSITVAGGARSSAEVRLPGGTMAKLYGGNASASFSVAEDGSASGHTLTGTVRVRPENGRSKTYRSGDMWGAKVGDAPKRTIANAPQRQPGATKEPVEVATISGDAGPVNAALNGIPVTLGDGLAGVGASSDIVAAGRRVELAIENPTIERFPSGDFATLIAAAAQLEDVYGGTPFEAAQADIIRSYLGFLASGASGADFLTAYSAFALQYLELIRAGGVPSGFASGTANAADIDAYLAFLQRNGALAGLAAQDQALVDAYLRFLSSGQDRDGFASSLAELTQNYLDFLRAGGVPTEFTGASQEALADAIAFLQQSGLLASLSASDQAFISAFIANGGADFAAVFQQALSEYFAFIASGQLPSDFSALDETTLRAYLETLSNTGLLDRLPAEQAQFFADYLAFLRDGGSVDGFAGLPVYLDYVDALNAYFAFLEAGGLPSEYTELDQATIQAYLAALTAAQGGLAGFGDLNDFFVEYFNFLLAGNDPDLFDGLPGAGGSTGGGNTGGGNGGGNPGGGNNPTLVYTGGFTPQGTGIIGAGSWADDGRDPIDDAYVRDIRLLGPGVNDAILDENGGLEQYVFARQNFVYADRGTAQTVEISGNEDLLIGRWTNGTYQRSNGRGELFGYDLTANQGFHYLLANGFTGPADYPTGRVEYELLAATSPTLIDGSQAPGTFAADAAIIFGTSPAFAIEGSIGFADFTYNFATDGGVEGEGQAIFLPSEGSGNLGYFNVAAPGSRGAGFDGQIVFQVQIPDAQASQFGTQYTASDFNLSNSADAVAIVGAAIFGAVDGDGGNAGGNDTVLSDQAVTFISLENGREIYDRRFTDVTYDEGTGAPIGLFVAEALSPQLGDAELVDTGSTPDGNLAWGRWRNGTIGGQINGEANITLGSQGLHIFSGTNPDTLPTSGLIEYELIGSTTPTLTNGATGTLDAARAVVAYGTEAKLGLDFTVSADGSSYNVTTPGGLDATAQNGLSVSANNIFALVNSNGTGGLEISGTGSICDSATCRVDLRGAFYGDGSSNPSIGLAYSIGELSALRVYGTFALGPLGEFNDGGNGGGGMGGGSGFTGTRDNLVYYNFLDGSLNTGFGGSVDFVDGQITGMSSLVGTVSSNDATIVEATDLGEVAWARWTNGTVLTTGLLGNLDFDVGPNGGYHVMAGEVTTSLPGGTVAYELIGGTSATDNAGNAPGTLTGDLAIAFGTTSLVGYDLTMDVGGRSWSVSTNGGAADPASSDINLVVSSAGFTFGGSFTNSVGTVTSTGDACSISCFINVSGTLYGDDAAYAALAMNVTDSAIGRVVAASGIAVFGQEGAASASSVQAPLSASAGADWSRWDVAASATSDAPAAMAPTTQPSLAATTASAATDRASAIVQAEAMTGGMVSWGGAQQQ